MIRFYLDRSKKELSGLKDEKTTMGFYGSGGPDFMVRGQDFTSEIVIIRVSKMTRNVKKRQVL